MLVSEARQKRRKVQAVCRFARKSSVVSGLRSQTHTKPGTPPASGVCVVHVTQTEMAQGIPHAWRLPYCPMEAELCPTISGAQENHPLCLNSIPGEI
jgi:hypothetical protein